MFHIRLKSEHMFYSHCDSFRKSSVHPVMTSL